VGWLIDLADFGFLFLVAYWWARRQVPALATLGARLGALAIAGCMARHVPAAIGHGVSGCRGCRG
jgi:hypothetical protein